MSKRCRLISIILCNLFRSKFIRWILSIWKPTEKRHSLTDKLTNWWNITYGFMTSIATWNIMHDQWKSHTMDLLWEKFQWILPLYMKPISFQSKASVVCSVTAVIFIGFCLKKVNVFSQHIGKKTNEYLNSAEQITRNWNVDQLSVLITSWDII